MKSNTIRLNRRKRSGSHIVMALALATGLAVAATGFAEPAYAAQKKNKKDDKKADAPEYSDEFRELYAPIAKSYNEAPDNRAALAPQIPALVAASTTPDDKKAAGSLVYNIGVISGDEAMQKQGLTMELESGKATSERTAQLNFLAGQNAYRAKDFAGARTYYQRALDGGYTENDPEMLIAESYVGSQEFPKALEFYRKRINDRIAAGQTLDRETILRARTIAMQADLVDDATEFTEYMVRYYPSTEAWGDAIAIQRNYGNYDKPELLDLMRLAARTDSLRTERDYIDYIVAADTLRQASEVNRVAKQGVAAGLLRNDDTLVMDVLAESDRRMKIDKSELAGLEADARKAGSKATLVTSAGDVLLGMGRPAKAEEYYRLALTRPGVDTPRVLTRLGIAQLDQGDVSGANETFAKVEGARKAIARLWGAYAAQEAGGTPAAAATEDAL
ncbi:hypothetical protein HME9302_01185 [Alteripontixanthobacter maritimus]|uniref:Tetratricopeptide repeat protein n=1 Tax=Alteripontixanthobacter maritimus TaxID=2161824 RepID=A0A369Q9Q7_9SPHN|nr:tetratricopeptide repeat protein [Alteripontixanthobacter maritimus]RDC59987.1 hypothetical protein HME9302_01185 [Alteripontixanthobacter maritimus]